MVVRSDNLAARTESICASISRLSLSLTLEESQFAWSISAPAKGKITCNQLTRKTWLQQPYNLTPLTKYTALDGEEYLILAANKV